MIRKNFFISLIIALILLTGIDTWAAVAPTVTATVLTGKAATTTADFSSSATDYGDLGNNFNERGIVWSINPTPNYLADDNGVTTEVVSVMVGPYTTGAFTQNVTGLTAGTTYYARAFVINDNGDIGYGTEISFIAGSPTLNTTDAFSSVTAGNATTGGNVIDDGASSITAKGIVYSTSTLPTLLNGASISIHANTAIGSYTINLTDLTAGTPYYARAYATNANGTTYGTEVTTTT